MIWFDTTKSASAKHKSGLLRVNARLRDALGDAACGAGWKEARDRASATDWFVTGELFSETERPGFRDFLAQAPCRKAAIFHDAIPLRHPEITWPQSVARHPDYMKQLARFDRVWAVSAASREALIDYWRWAGIARVPEVKTLPLGADFDGSPRRVSPPEPVAPFLLCVGIVEPRKNQAFLLRVCEALWRDGLMFELHLVGRVNPHFGAPVVREIKRLRKLYPGLHYHEAVTDRVLAGLFDRARATVFPTIAEGCGLPLLESLWRGVPCVCSDLPVLRENADGGGCWSVPLNDFDRWGEAIRTVVSDAARVAELSAQARTRSLPTWAGTAEILRAGLGR